MLARNFSALSTSKMTLSPKARQARPAPDTSATYQEAVMESEPNFLEGSLAYSVKRAQVRCDALLVRYLDSEISPARLSALCCVGANPGISQIALGTLLNIAGASVVKVIDDLEKLELVQRVPTADRRVYALHLTQTGLSNLRRYAAAVREFETAIAASLSVEERKKLRALLEKVASR